MVHRVDAPGGFRFFDLGFVADYAVDVIGRRLASGREGEAGAGLEVSVRATGSQWMRLFDRGEDDAAISGVFATPAPNVLLIAYNGVGEFVGAEGGEGLGAACVSPVTCIAATNDGELLLIVGIRSLEAYDSAGLRWALSGVGDDDIEIDRVVGGDIIARYYSVESSSEAEARIDTRTGSVIGASSRCKRIFARTTIDRTTPGAWGCTSLTL